MKKPKQEIIELNRDQMEALLQRAETQQLRDEDYETIKGLIESYAYLTQLLGDKRTSLHRLRKLLFGSGSEKTRDVVQNNEGTSSSASDSDDDAPP